MANNLARRLLEHNQKLCQTTRDLVSWKLIYQEKAITRKEARTREVFFNSGIGRERIRRILTWSPTLNQSLKLNPWATKYSPKNSP
jgi:predicted GIY-YIG superfamily endonuclease